MWTMELDYIVCDKKYVVSVVTLREGDIDFRGKMSTKIVRGSYFKRGRHLTFVVKCLQK